VSGQITVWGASRLLSNAFSRTTTPPLNYYMALLPSVAPTAFINGSEFVELTGGGYSRVQIPNDGTAWVLGTDQTNVANKAGITFPTASANWGTIRYWALTDASTGGNVYFTGSFNTPVTVNSGDIMTVAAGNLVLSVSILTSATS
jgi:hypothetical protein